VIWAAAIWRVSGMGHRCSLSAYGNVSPHCSGFQAIAKVTTMPASSGFVREPRANTVANETVIGRE
jgi:hypothetical protein